MGSSNGDTADSRFRSLTQCHRKSASPCRQTIFALERPWPPTRGKGEDRKDSSSMPGNRPPGPVGRSRREASRQLRVSLAFRIRRQGVGALRAWFLHCSQTSVGGWIVAAESGRCLSRAIRQGDFGLRLVSRLAFPEISDILQFVTGTLVAGGPGFSVWTGDERRSPPEARFGHRRFGWQPAVCDALRRPDFRQESKE